MGVWAYGCIVHGCIVYGCMSVWGCISAWAYGGACILFVVVRACVRACKGVRECVLGGMGVWLHGCMEVWTHGCMGL